MADLEEPLYIVQDFPSVPTEAWEAAIHVDLKGADYNKKLLLVIPGADDELQGIKRGIIEMVDGMVINKGRRRGSSCREACAKAV